jgi:hypothetical protein
MKYSKIILTSLLAFSLASAYAKGVKGDTVSKGTIRVCKCFIINGGGDIPFFGNQVDTVKPNTMIPACLQLSSSCPESNKIISFEMVISSNGLSKAFVSNGGCMTGEMESAFVSQGSNGGYIIIQDVKMGLPGGKVARIPGKTFFIPKQGTK